MLIEVLSCAGVSHGKTCRVASLHKPNDEAKLAGRLQSALTAAITTPSGIFA
jgi:hypothetical protein